MPRWVTKEVKGSLVLDLGSGRGKVARMEGPNWEEHGELF